MSKQQITRAVVTPDGQMLIEQPDGSYRPARDGTDWAALDTLSEEELETAIASDPDDPGNDPTFLEKAKPIYPVPRTRVTMHLDRDIVDFFKRQGAGYQTRIQAVLQSYVEAHRQR